MYNDQPTICLMGHNPLDRIAYSLLLEHHLNYAVAVESDFSATSVWAALREKPTLVIIHADGDSTDMISAIDMVGRLQPATRVLVVVTHPLPYFSDAFAKQQIHGYVSKADGKEEFCAAVQNVLANRSHLSPQVSQLESNASNGNGSRRPRAPLSRRETELLPLLASGLTLREAAAKMTISYKTADSYRTNLFRKLGVRDRVDLARYAIREHIIEA